MEIELTFTEIVHRSVIVKADSLEDAEAKWLDDDEWYEDAYKNSSEDRFRFAGGVDLGSAVFQELN